MLTPYAAFTSDGFGKTYEALFKCGRRGLVEQVGIMDKFIEYTKLKEKKYCL